MTATTGLEVDGLTVRFGGLVAVSGVSLKAPRGQITGLIGPNGAGKSTTFNACSGLNRPSSGKVMLDGHDVSHTSPAGRARRGLGRTFQKMELFESLTVVENVALGREGTMAGANPLKQMFATRAERREAQERAEQAVELCGLQDLALRRPSELSTGPSSWPGSPPVSSRSCCSTSRRPVWTRARHAASATSCYSSWLSVAPASSSWSTT